MTGKPPYTITEKAADYLAKIVETATRLSIGTGFLRNIRLHRENRLRTIHSSLAIEGNSLSLGEVTAVLEGKVVAGKQEDVKEVRNAYEAYDRMMTFSPYAISDFLKAHKLVTQGLVKEAGKFRSGDVGVFNGDVAVHMGARPQFVQPLMKELFRWARTSDLHPVLKSAVLHYEIETIHPFADGNGRMGRLWQTLLLAKWNPIFAWIPMEAVLCQNRNQYYQAIEKARKANDSGVFIEFTLASLYQMLMQQELMQSEHSEEKQDSHQDKHQEERQVIRQEKHQDKHREEYGDEHQDKHRDENPEKPPKPHLKEPVIAYGDGQSPFLSDASRAVMSVLKGNVMSRKDIFIAIGMNGDSRAFNRILRPLLNNGFVEMTIPEKPNSKMQKYRLTKKGVLYQQHHPR
jgi:Fic family protein/predicted transcriptional regulator